MKSSVLVALAVAGDAVVALPAEDQGHAFSLTAKYNDNAELNFARAVSRLSSKYALANGNQATNTSTVPATPRFPGDEIYTVEVEIGTPAQKLNLDLDTGSSDMWVFSNDTEARFVNGQTLYLPANSTTVKRMDNLTWGIQYGDGSQCSGIVYQDVVTIGGLEFDSQAVESAQYVTESFTEMKICSGLLGLANNAGNTVKPTKQKTWFSNVMQKLKQPLFTVRLRHETDGSYNFGYIDKSQYSGDVVYTPAFSNKFGHRLFNATGYAVGNGTVKEVAITATPDTGTSLFLMPNDIAADYWSSVDNSTSSTGDDGEIQYTFPCNTTLPPFTLVLGDKNVTVPSKVLTYTQTEGNADRCVGGITGGDAIAPFGVFGDIFIKGVFVIFDDGNSQIGFAEGK